MKPTIRLLSSVLSLALLASSAARISRAQDAPDPAAVRIQQDLLDLGTIGRVMNLAAHPDDEDGATLAYCRHGQGLFTVAVFANRGEGGQNEIGPELYEDLGKIREKETLSATSIEGAEACFLGLTDFGFSKNADEAFAKWGGVDHVTERVTWAIRKYRPDVIFTNHDPDTGHGQHRAVAIAARRAFDLAGDPRAFPEQLNDSIRPWSPTIYMERVSSPGQSDEESKKKLAEIPPAELVHLDVDVVDALRGTTYREEARVALQQHKSQGRWTELGAKERSWHVIRRRDDALLPPNEAPLDATNLTRLRIFRAIEARALSNDEQAALLTPSLFSPAWPNPAQSGRLAEFLFARRDLLDRTLPPAAADAPPARRELDVDWRLQRQRIDRALADVVGIRADMLPVAGSAVTRPLPRDVAIVAQEGDAFVVRYTPTGDTFLVPNHGLLAAPARAAALFTFHPNAVVGIGRPGQPDVEIRTVLAVVLPPAPASQPASAPARRAELLTVSMDGATVFDAEIPAGASGHRSIPVRFRAPIAATGAPTTFTLSSTEGASASFEARRIDVDVPDGLRVGIVKSYDDTLETALEDLGVDARLLSEDDLAFRDLSRFDAILVDLRAYFVRDDLVKFNDRLKACCENGGTVAVFYQKTFEWNAKENGGRSFAPFPLELSSDRVTDEGAAVTLLQPDHPLLARPNRLAPADFDGWLHERGLYFPKKDHAPEYQELLSMHDPGEEPLNTGLLVAPVGTGAWVYTSLGWYRQWRNGNAGAYRFLANLVSLKRTRAP